MNIRYCILTLQIILYVVVLLSPGGDSDAASCLGNHHPPCFSMVKAIFPYLSLRALSDPFPFGDSGELQIDLQRELLLILDAFLMPS